MSNTPRTDEEEFDTENICSGGPMAVTSHFARELERESNAYKQLYEQALEERNILHKFVYDITEATGPYPDINVTDVVMDAYKTLRKVKGVKHGG